MNQKVVVCLLVIALASSCFARTLPKAGYGGPSKPGYSPQVKHDSILMKHDITQVEHQEAHPEVHPEAHQEAHPEAHPEEHKEVVMDKPIEHKETPLAASPKAVEVPAKAAEEAPMKAEEEGAGAAAAGEESSE